MEFNKIEEALKAIAAGKMIIVLDDEDRENEGDFIMAAELVTGEAINFMAKYGRGLICTPISTSIAKKLSLNLMVDSNKSLHETAFTVSIDSIHAGTGISCPDRALTIQAMTDANCTPAEFLRPGHVFPLIANDGGVISRPGHTEAACDLAELVGLKRAGVICEIMNDDGTMARTDDLLQLAQELELCIITIKDLIQYKTNLLQKSSRQRNDHYENV